MTGPVILVTGGREHSDPNAIHALVSRTLTEVAPAMVINGAAAGVDRWASLWCQHEPAQEVACPVHKSGWHFHGKAAGSIRNGLMVAMCKALGGSVLAFPGGRGTADCVRQARAAGLEVVEVRL